MGANKSNEFVGNFKPVADQGGKREAINCGE